jgi:hypothetical protein
MISAKKKFTFFGVKPILSIYSKYDESKNEFRANFFFRLSRGVAGLAVGFWTKFEAPLAQPC